MLANPKTILNDRYAKREIKEKVIRADQLISYIKSTDEMEKNYKMSEAAMYELARFYLDNNQPKRTDYTLKYREMVKQVKAEQEMYETSETYEETAYDTEPQPQGQANEDIMQEYDINELIKRLKAYRLNQSRAENKKPYMIFNDAQMMDLIEKKPQDKEELQQVSGFGAVKAEKYGDAIIEILHQND